MALEWKITGEKSRHELNMHSSQDITCTYVVSGTRYFLVTVVSFEDRKGLGAGRESREGKDGKM